MIKNIATRVAIVGMTFGLATLALADTAFSTSSAPTLVLGMIGDVALIIGIVIGAILGLLAALLGLGWGVKKFRHYITGKKF